MTGREITAVVTAIGGLAGGAGTAAIQWDVAKQCKDDKAIIVESFQKAAERLDRAMTRCQDRVDACMGDDDE